MCACFSVLYFVVFLSACMGGFLVPVSVCLCCGVFAGFWLFNWRAVTQRPILSLSNGTEQFVGKAAPIAQPQTHAVLRSNGYRNAFVIHVHTHLRNHKTHNKPYCNRTTNQKAKPAIFPFKVQRSSASRHSIWAAPVVQPRRAPYQSTDKLMHAISMHVMRAHAINTHAISTPPAHKGHLSYLKEMFMTSSRAAVWTWHDVGLRRGFALFIYPWPEKN